MIRFPYGIANYRRIRQRGMFYVDRTGWIGELERLGDTLVFLRPRRFGKSLWLQTLASYYDFRLADEFDALFGDLAIGQAPTDERNRYFVLQWNFSEVSARGTVRELAERLHAYLNNQVKDFLVDYQGHLPGAVEIGSEATDTLRHLLGQVRKTPYQLCLLIDEYDNFVNDVMVRDIEAYRALFDKDGPFKDIFKSIKSGAEGKGIARVYVTGVSPVALNDLTSGFNNAQDVSHRPELASLCGFREFELRAAIDQIAQERKLDETTDALLDIMRRWYNGYRFARDADERVYNPTNAIYFLQSLADEGKPPQELYDQNLRADRSKLSFLAQSGAGTGVIEQLAEGDGSVVIGKLKTGFSVEDLTSLDEDPDAIASMLYYMGMLTRAAGVLPRLCIPNQVVRKLFLDRLLQLSLAKPTDDYKARRAALAFFDSGAIGPLLSFFEQDLLPLLSNRDRGAAPKRPGLSGGGVNEMTIKALFLAILFDDAYYMIFSELELERRYADLCLLVRSEMRRHGFSDLLFEFKLVRRAALGKTGEALGDMSDEALAALPPVAAALDEARRQVRAYREALKRKLGEAKPRCYAVVAVGLERMLGEQVS